MVERLFGCRLVGAIRLHAFMVAIGLTIALASPAIAATQAVPLKVVASFSILGDMAHEIGGQTIALTTIVPPDGDAHSFEPTPKDARSLASAQLLIINGLSFEGWLPRLIKASGFNGRVVVASRGVVPRRLSAAEQALEDQEEHGSNGVRGPRGGLASAVDHGAASTDRSTDIDPHAWQSLANGEIYARNIAVALAQADPAHAAHYESRADDYIQQMKALDGDIKTALAAIPAERRKVVTSHDAFGYFGRAYGVRFIAATGLSNEAEPSAKDIAGIIDQVRKEHVPAVFIENITSPKLVEQIARETGAKVGGTLYSDALAQPGQPAGTYLGMFKWNARQLIDALRSATK